MIRLPLLLCLLCLLCTSLQFCPAGYYDNLNTTDIATCIKCAFPCLECFNTVNFTLCTKYANGYVNGTPYCAASGGLRTYLNPISNRCESTCLEGCSSCSQGDYGFCFTCATGYVLEGNTCKSSILYNGVLIAFISLLAALKVGELGYKYYKYRKVEDEKEEEVEKERKRRRYE
jgi:hypothetical protein